MDQKNPEVIKEKFIWIGRILDANYDKAGLEQEVNTVIYLNKFQRVILLSCLKHKDFFHGNLVEWTRPLLDTPLK